MENKESIKFKINDIVNFKRNSIIHKSKTKIIAVVNSENENDSKSASYVIEHDSGWTPNNIRIGKYGLDANKKYLFVSESELTSIDKRDATIK